MRAAAAASSYGICRLFGIQPLINLADLCPCNMQLQMLRKVSCKSILTGLDIAKTLHYCRRLLCAVVVGGIFRDGWHLNGGPTGVVYFSIRRIGGDFKFHINIVTNAYNDDSVPRLRDSVGLKFVQIWIELIACCTHFIQNFCECLAVIGILQTTHILSQKPLRPIQLENLHAIGVKGTVYAVHAFLFSHNTVIVAGEAESKGVNRGELCQIQFADVSVVYASGHIRADVAPVSLAGVFIVIVCPCMNDFEIRIADISVCCAPCQSAWSAE